MLTILATFVCMLNYKHAYIINQNNFEGLIQLAKFVAFGFYDIESNFGVFCSSKVYAMNIGLWLAKTQLTKVTAIDASLRCLPCTWWKSRDIR